ncbi:hypothetical protein CS537_00740 [Yersinia mollaretii]|nr:hypothetical protein CS537_00740 [Yersinia mollaretii]
MEILCLHNIIESQRIPVVKGDDLVKMFTIYIDRKNYMRYALNEKLRKNDLVRWEKLKDVLATMPK